MPDDTVYGFGKNDGDAVVRLIGADGGEVPHCRQPHGGDGTRLYRFSITGAWASGAAPADITLMDGTAVASTYVEDPEAIFSTLGSGDTGLCLRQGGAYWVIQANCPAGA